MMNQVKDLRRSRGVRLQSGECPIMTMHPSLQTVAETCDSSKARMKPNRRQYTQLLTTGYSAMWFRVTSTELPVSVRSTREGVQSAPDSGVHSLRFGPSRAIRIGTLCISLTCSSPFKQLQVGFDTQLRGRILEQLCL